MKEGWKFCPSCGFLLEKEQHGAFSDVFERMEHEMKDMNRAFEKNFEFADLMPMFPRNTRPVRGSGFSIRISQSGDGRPKVDVQTFGDVNRKQVESEASRLGFRDRLSKALKPEKKEQEPQRPGQSRGVCLAAAKTTEEPETCVRNVAGRIIAEIKLPGVKGPEDIEIKQLDNSIELKAIAGDKAYFKILTKPPQKAIARREFRKGTLFVEFA